MKTYRLIFCCLLGLIICGIISMPSDTRARRFNPEDVRKQLEASGVNPEDGQTREERLEALRNQAGTAAPDTAVKTRSGLATQNAADIGIFAVNQLIMQLDNDLVDGVIQTAKQLLRQDPEYRKLLQDLGGVMPEQ